MNLSMPEPIHQTTYRVLYGDTDAGGMVYYGNYLRYFELGRTEYIRDLARTSYREIEARGLILPVIECYTRYKAPAVYDDLLVIETSLNQLKKVSCRFTYRILKHADDGSKKLLAKGFTVNAAVDRSGKLARLPADLIERLKKNISLSE